MELPVSGHTPPQAVSYERALARHFVASGILLRAIMALEATPKPWPNSVKRARLLLAQVRGMNTDIWRSFTDAERQSIADQRGTAPNSVGGANATRSDVHRK